MVTKEFNNLEGWVKDKAQKHIDELTKALRENLSKAEFRWTCEEQFEIISSLKEIWQKKLDYIKTVLNTMETEVLGAPIADSKKDEDTSEHRQFTLRYLDETFDKAKQAFARWNISGKRLKKFFSDATSDETEVKDEGAKEPEERRPRG